MNTKTIIATITITLLCAAASHAQMPYRAGWGGGCGGGGYYGGYYGNPGYGNQWGAFGNGNGATLGSIASIVAAAAPIIAPIAQQVVVRPQPVYQQQQPQVIYIQR